MNIESPQFLWNTPTAPTAARGLILKKQPRASARISAKKRFDATALTIKNFTRGADWPAISRLPYGSGFHEDSLRNLLKASWTIQDQGHFYDCELGHAAGFDGSGALASVGITAIAAQRFAAPTVRDLLILR